MSRTPDLFRILENDGSLRRNRLWFNVASMAVPILAAVAVQSAIYAVVVARAGRGDWDNHLAVIALLALVPPVVAVLLVSMRDQEFPLTGAAFITANVFVFAVAALSALRVPLSYVGIFATIPGTVAIMVAANVRFRRAGYERVAILPFSGAERLREQLGGNVRPLEPPFDRLADVDRVLIDTEHHSHEWAHILTRLHMHGVEVTPWLKYLELRLRRVDISHFDVTHLSYSLGQFYYFKAKRFFDVLAVLVALPVVLPLGGLIALYIYAIDGRPVIFAQTRRGYGGGTFTLYKFRTMYRDAGDHAAQKNDRRILPGCRTLRQFRLDELPQLYNIIRGEMSWIGPRPVAVAIAEPLEILAPQYVHRHLVLPGLTGWAQVSHKYASNPEEELEKLAYDLYYIKELSFDLDLLILFRTIRVLLLRSGAR